jgi:hypothetical protein
MKYITNKTLMAFPKEADLKKLSIIPIGTKLILDGGNDGEELGIVPDDPSHRKAIATLSNIEPEKIDYVFVSYGNDGFKIQGTKEKSYLEISGYQCCKINASYGNVGYEINLISPEDEYIDKCDGGYKVGKPILTIRTEKKHKGKKYAFYNHCHKKWGKEPAMEIIPPCAPFEIKSKLASMDIPVLDSSDKMLCSLFAITYHSKTYYLVDTDNFKASLTPITTAIGTSLRHARQM